MCGVWIWIVFFTENEERINILTDFRFFCFIWANLEKKPGDLRWFASQREVECLIFQLEWHRDDATVAWVDTVQRRYSTLLCHTINATRETQTLLPFPSAVISPPFILPPSRCFFPPQQSITTMPEERRNCRCRLETPCTYWRNMKVRLDGSSVTCVFSQMSAEPFSLSPTDSLFCQTGSEDIGWGGNPKRWVASSWSLVTKMLVNSWIRIVQRSRQIELIMWSSLPLGRAYFLPVTST